MQYLTDFADLAVVLPFALAVGVSLLWAGWRRGALAWATVVPATLAAVLLGKMVIAGCGDYLPFHSFYHGLKSPSGHTASAAVVYGGLLSLLLPEPRRDLRRPLAAVLLAGIFAMVVGGSRLALHLHTRSDVVAGAALGIAGAMVLARLAGPRPARLALGRPLALALLVLLLLHGRHLWAEGQIDRISHLLWPLTLCRNPR